MEPENDKPGASEAETEAKQVEGKAASEGGEAGVVGGGAPRMLGAGWMSAGLRRCRGGSC